MASSGFMSQIKARRIIIWQEGIVDNDILVCVVRLEANTIKTFPHVCNDIIRRAIEAPSQLY